MSRAAEKSAAERLRAGVWEVWGQYVLATRLHDPEAPRYIRAPSAAASGLSPEPYQPLLWYPDLFLRLGRLGDEGALDEDLDTEQNAATALEWSSAYGTLGLTIVEDARRSAASTRGGPADTVAAFASEAWTANGALRLYEAATSPDGSDVAAISPYIAPRHRDFFTETPDKAAEWALLSVAQTVQEKVARHAYPALYGEPDAFVQGWDFANLLGAMWLQAFWLLTAEREPRRCKNWECRRIIAFEQPEQPGRSLQNNDRSGGYRTRRDKKFCSRKCRNRYNYLTRTNPQRQAGRGR